MNEMGLKIGITRKATQKFVSPLNHWEVGENEGLGLGLEGA